MAYRCSICQKGPVTGKNISHSHRVTNRVFSANLHRVKLASPNGPHRDYVCTTCIKSGRVRKAQ
jgi:large subunit ribosomal protein L28